MKRFGRLFEQIADFENLERAYRNARRGKGWQRVVQEFDTHWEQGLQEIRETLLRGKYQTSEYRTKLITEPKPRVITAAKVHGSANKKDTAHTTEALATVQQHPLSIHFGIV